MNRFFKPGLGQAVPGLFYVGAVAFAVVALPLDDAAAQAPLYRLQADRASDIHWSNVRLEPNAAATAVQIDGSGVINRFWCTILPKDDRTNDYLGRALVVNLYWDGSAKPAVSVPLADFFCQPLQLQAIDNRLFSASNGLCVFNSLIPMPFRRGFRLEVENGTDEKLQFWYGLDVERRPIDDADLYLHAYWQRRPHAAASEEITVLPTVTGKGRYLGTHWALRQKNPDEAWRWYSRPVRIDRDVERPLERPSMLVGTLDDFVCSGWWSRETSRTAYASAFTGRPLVRSEANGDLSIVLYRYHVDDPLWFHKNFTLTVGKHVSFARTPEPEVAEGDWSTTSFFYLDQPSTPLPPVPDAQARTAGF